MTTRNGREEKADSMQVGGFINEQESEKRDDRRLASDLATLFNMLDRLLTMMMVYPKGHPLIDGFGEQVAARFKRMFEEHEDSIDIEVGALELKTFLGTPCFSRELSDKEQFLWYAAYADGLLRITFSEGITSMEILEFMGVINRANQGNIASDDDTVTLLWELNLPHIDYFAVEGFVDSGGIDAFDNIPEPEAVAMVADAAIDPSGDAASRLHTMFSNLNMARLDVFTRMHMQASAEMVTSELKDADLAYAFGVDQGTIDTLNTEWTSGVDLEYRLIEALLSIVRTSPASDAGAKASELIKNVADQLIENCRYAQAARVLELLHDRQDLFEGADFDPLKELIEKLSGPLQLEVLLYAMQKSTENRDQIVQLMLLLGPAKVQLQILRLLSDPKRKIVALKQLIDVLMAATLPENQHQITAKEYVESKTYLRRVLNGLADRDVSEFGPMSRLIRAGLGHDSIEARVAALSIDHPVFGDRNIAEKYLVPFSNDEDQELRKKAFERLGTYHPSYFKKVIRDTVLSKKFKGRTAGELRFLMRVFLENDTDAAQHLRAMLKVSGWFGRSSREFAKMAASVLASAQDQEALALITSQSKKFFVNPDLKRSYESTLARIRIVEAPKELAGPVEVDEPANSIFSAVMPDEGDDG